jgi:hypothetical protein
MPLSLRIALDVMSGDQPEKGVYSALARLYGSLPLLVKQLAWASSGA